MTSNATINFNQRGIIGISLIALGLLLAIVCQQDGIGPEVSLRGMRALAMCVVLVGVAFYASYTRWWRFAEMTSTLIRLKVIGIIMVVRVLFF